MSLSIHTRKITTKVGLINRLCFGPRIGELE